MTGRLNDARRGDWQDVPPTDDPADLGHPSDGRPAAGSSERRSLDLAIGEAVCAAGCGEWQRFVTAMCDALWLAHTGAHERVDDHRMVVLLRALAGTEWAPR